MIVFVGSVGAGFGTFLNTILSSWLLCVLLVGLLVIMGKRTIQKAIEARQREHWGCLGDRERAPLIGATINRSSVRTLLLTP